MNKEIVSNNLRIVMLGAGNVATHLGNALQQQGFSIVQIYSRTAVSAQRLADALHAKYVCRPKSIARDADLYIFAVKDSALPELASALPSNAGLWLHTAGNVDMNVFAPYTERRGVLYPLQTFSRERHVNFSEIPLFVECYREEDALLLEQVAVKLSDHVVRLTSEQRKYLHLAAVFACNFTNHLYAIAMQILEQQGLDRQLLLPLIRETAAKIETMHPNAAQTGPAIRHDIDSINRHLQLLANKPDWKQIYETITEDIIHQ